MFARNESKPSHSLRLSLFILRIILGVNLFYVGWSTLFNLGLVPTLGKRSLGGLYAWLGAPTNIAWLHPVARWTFLIAGICLIIGFATRLASLAAAAFILASYLPNLSLANLDISQLANNELIFGLCLILMIFSKAGSYLGLDKFFHFSLRSKNK